MNVKDADVTGLKRTTKFRRQFTRQQLPTGATAVDVKVGRVPKKADESGGEFTWQQSTGITAVDVTSESRADESGGVCTRWQSSGITAVDVTGEKRTTKSGGKFTRQQSR